VNWQRTARWIVAAVGIGVAVAIVAYSRRRPEPPPRPPELANIDQAASVQGGAGQTVVLRAGNSPITIDYGSIRKYDDGRGHFENVTIKGLEESKFTVTAKVLETAAPLAGSDKPQKLNLSGGVSLTTEDGLELKSDTASWDEKANRMMMPGKVSFKKGRLSGTGVGATYDRETDSFMLLDKAEAHVDVDKEGHGGADLSSSKMNLVRGQHIVQLIDNAKIVGEVQTLTSKNATLSFTEDESAVKYLELRERAKVETKPGAKSDKPTMNADNITMAFYEDGVTLKHATLTGQSVLTLAGANARSIRASRIDVDLAPDGQTLTDLRGTDRVVVTIAATATAPGRTITSNTLKATGDEKRGLTSARFEGSPQFEETAAAGPRRGGPSAAKPQRTGTAQTLILTLGGQIDAIEQAEFNQNAHFTDGDVTGDADIAQYNEAKGTLKLMPNDREPRRVSRVDTADMSVNAHVINVNTNTDDLDAKGAVGTNTKRAAGDTTKSNSLFGGKEPILGFAESFVYTKSSGKAIYTGTPAARARLTQGDSRVTGERIEYSDTTRNLNASGNVDSVWLLDSATSKQVKKQVVRAETLTYDEEGRTAVYTGALVHVTTDEGIVEGRTVTFRLAAASRTLETMEAQTDVYATLSEGYEALGHVLIYTAKNETYVVVGRPGVKPAVVKSPDNNAQPTTAGNKPDTPQCKWTESMRLELNRRTNSVTIPGDGQAPQSTTQKACSIPLRSSK